MNFQGIIVIIITISTTIKADNFTHTKLNNTGIFFENLDEINFYGNKLEVITSIKLKSTSELINTLLTCNKHLKELCDELIKVDEGNPCNAFLKELKWQIEEIDRQENKIKEMYGRKKRSLFDAVGKLSNFLFGTMDAEDAHNIYSSLDAANEEQAKLLNLEKNQIAIIQSNFNSLTQPITELQNETEIIEAKLNDLIGMTYKQEELAYRFRTINLQISEISSLLLIKCLHINRQQDEATEIITALDNHKLHPLIISYANLTALIKNLDIGTDVNEKILVHEQLRQITTVDYLELEDQVIVKITIPLIEKEKFTLYKAYLTPIIRKQTTIAYSTEVEYIATNIDRSKFIQMKASEVGECREITAHLDSKYKLCEQLQPTITDKSNYCLPVLLENPFGTSKNCEYTTARPLNTIVKLVHSNAWLYSVCNPTTFLIQCGKITETIDVVNEGILTFFTKCKITAKDFSIQIKGLTETVKFEQPPNPPTSKEFNLPEIDFTFINEINQKFNSKMAPIKINSHSNHNNDFLSENKKIDNLSSALNSLAKHKREIEVKQEVISYLVYTAIAIVIATVTLVILVNRYRKHRYDRSLNQKPIQNSEPKIIVIDSQLNSATDREPVRETQESNKAKPKAKINMQYGMTVV